MGPTELHILSQVQPIRVNDYVPTWKRGQGSIP